jgi:hypothetical protein
MAYLFFGSAASWYSYHLGYLATLGLIKLSILAFYLSFATHRKFRILVYISIAAVIVVSIISIFILAFQCPKNPSYALSPAILYDRGAGHCFNLKIIFYWQAGWNIASDLVILVLPMPLLFPLRMRTISGQLVEISRDTMADTSCFGRKLRLTRQSSVPVRLRFNRYSNEPSANCHYSNGPETRTTITVDAMLLLDHPLRR